MEQAFDIGEPALATLLTIYDQRKDLRDAFPEAAAGDYTRLVHWAVEVTRRRCHDSAFSTLHEHADWYYRQAFKPRPAVDPAVAFKTWDRSDDSLAAVERRIHDGVPVEQLHQRADKYVTIMSSSFPWAVPRPGGVVLEIGSGVGYIMEAASRRFRPSRIIGLDVAPNMVEKAKERLARDQVNIPAEFLVYDGITIPMENASVDYIYSVACLQHIPKPYVYHLFGEMLRILKPGCFAALHFLAFSLLRSRRESIDFPSEIDRQLSGYEGHWHHYYCKEELSYVLTYGYGAERVTTTEADGALWAAFSAKAA